MNQDMIAGLREALSITPGNTTLRQLLADTLLKLGQWQEAEKEFLMVLQQLPSHDAAKRGLGKAYLEQGKNAACIVVLEELNDRSNVDILVTLAKAYLRNEEPKKAMDAYRLALEFNPALKDEELDGLRITAEPEATTAAPGETIRPNVNFNDVGGMNHVKDEIRMKIIQPFQFPEMYRRFGKKAGGGILLYGPPGCGKTHLARATAGEIKASFISVGITDILDMWMGNSEMKLHQLFEMARAQKPCLLFFDEIDALGASRTDMRQSAGRMLINQMLTEMDGIQSENDGLLILGATNTPWHLDPAFRRPGRFDRIIFVQPPDDAARAEIFKIMLRDKPCEDIKYESLAQATAEFSGADIMAVVEGAIEDRLRASFESGKPEMIRQSDLMKSVKSRKPSTREWFNTARNYALYSNEAGLYDDILTYLKIKK